MKIAAVVPIKSLLQAKSRLAGTHTPQERAELAHHMLQHVLHVIAASEVVQSVAVISPTPSELRLPRDVTPLLQTSEGLNQLLEQGREWAKEQGAEAFMTTFADLPLLTAYDIAAIAGMGAEMDTVVLAPDRHSQGTNIMLLHPPTLLPFAFGPGSFQRHVALAHEARAHMQIYRSPGSTLDIDTPDDLAALHGLAACAGI